MYLIPQLTSEALQSQTLVLPDGTTLGLTIYFIPMQYGWFITKLTYGTFELNGLRITNNPNMLHQFKNVLPFGLGCFSKDDREPSQAEDFVSGASKLYVLSEAEVEQYSELLKNG